MRGAFFGLFLTLQCTSLAGLEWRNLPPVPDPHGVAAPFAGVTGDALVAAGGANFPDAAPWDGGAKVWHDTIYLLADPEGTWQEAGRLPRPLAYGVSLTTPRGILCIGGCDATTHYRECFYLTLKGGQLQTNPAPSLPTPLAYLAGALLGETVYVVGGTGAPTDTTASAQVFSLDLATPDAQWEALPDPFPGEGRILPVAAVQNGSLFVLSGASLAPDAEGKPTRTYLTDAWRYTPKKGWRQLTDLPRAAVAAPSPAPSLGKTSFLILGGDDGTLAGYQPLSQHPGFKGAVLSYDTVTDNWALRANLPDDISPPVTVPVVSWMGDFIIPSGEIRPGVRTPKVLAATPTPSKAHFGWLNWLVVGLYLTGMILVGVWFMKREAASTTEAYFRGGQRVPAWVAGLSIFATMLSALTFMGIPARAYQTDTSWYLGQLPILLVVPLVACCYLPFFRKLDLTSAYEYLEQRFNLACRLFAALSFVLFHLGRIAIVLYLPALALAAVSDLGVMPAILVIGILCIIYTVIGGIQAVVWTDAIQAIVLLGGALLCLILAVTRIDGGFGTVTEIATADAKLFQNLQWSSFDITDGTASAIVLFVAFFFNSLVPYTSSQDVVQRYVTTRDLPAARKSLRITMWMSVFGSMIFFALGVVVYAFYKSHPAQLEPTLPATDSILPFYIMQQLPVGVSGLVIAAIFAASQSTISSSLNSVATSFVKDIDARLLRPARPDQTYLRSAQTVVIIVGLLGVATALWMAQANIESAFKTFNKLIGLTAGSLGGLFALGTFSEKANGSGAFVGALAGFALVATLHFTGAPVSGLLYAFIGFTTCWVTGWLASHFLPGARDSSLSLRGSHIS